MKDLRNLLHNPPNEYRPIPFWAWNARLEAEESRRQVRELFEKGNGGFFMHARGGLTTPFMGDEWMENVKASIDEGENTIWAHGAMTKTAGPPALATAG